jgi:hypothetical protein
MKRGELSKKSQIKRLEELLLNHSSGDFFKCFICKTVKHIKECRQCWNIYCLDRNTVCSRCTVKKKWNDCSRCTSSFCECCKDLVLDKCEMPNCEEKVCERKCAVYACQHNICFQHMRFQESRSNTCSLCVFEREKNCKRSVAVVIGLLRRKSLCHKDIYKNVFISLFKNMVLDTRLKDCWDSRVLSEIQEAVSKTRRLV